MKVGKSEKTEVVTIIRAVFNDGRNWAQASAVTRLIDGSGGTGTQGDVRERGKLSDGVF